MDRQAPKKGRVKGRRCDGPVCETPVPCDRIFCADCWSMVRPDTQRELVMAYTPDAPWVAQTIKFDYLRAAAVKDIEDHLWGRQ